jgi:hypothetical protein
MGIEYNNPYTVDPAEFVESKYPDLCDKFGEIEFKEYLSKFYDKFIEYLDENVLTDYESHYGNLSLEDPGDDIIPFMIKMYEQILPDKFFVNFKRRELQVFLYMNATPFFKTIGKMRNRYNGDFLYFNFMDYDKIFFLSIIKCSL